MRINIDNKEYRLWFEYDACPSYRHFGKYSKLEEKTIVRCSISDADETWIYAKQVRHWTSEFRKLVHRKDALAKALKTVWPGHEHKAERRLAWQQVFKQMRML